MGYDVCDGPEVDSDENCFVICTCMVCGVSKVRSAREECGGRK